MDGAENKSMMTTALPPVAALREASSRDVGETVAWEQVAEPLLFGHVETGRARGRVAA